jgi:hypothetical protein
MNRYDLILAAIAATVVASCATPPSQMAENESPDDKAYVTGSRLPVRDNSTSANVKGISGKDAMDELRRNSTAGAPPMPGK